MYDKVARYGEGSPEVTGERAFGSGCFGSGFGGFFFNTARTAGCKRAKRRQALQSVREEQEREAVLARRGRLLGLSSRCCLGPARWAWRERGLLGHAASALSPPDLSARVAALPLSPASCPQPLLLQPPFSPVLPSPLLPFCSGGL